MEDELNLSLFAKIVIFIAVIVCMAVTLLIPGGEGWWSDLVKHLTSIFGGIAFTMLISIIIHSLQYKRRFFMYLLSKTKYHRYRVRFSCSYLFIIQVEGEYLLITSGNRRHFQLVGGVYKRFAEAYAELQTLGFGEDVVFPNIEEKRMDLRLMLPIDNSVAFIKWFEKEKHREISPSREFYEELIRPGILDRENFLYINYRRKGRLVTPFQHKQHGGQEYKQIQIFDVFELIPDDLQYADLRALRARGHEDVIFVRENDIQDLGTKIGDVIVPISEPTKWAFNMKYEQSRKP